MKRFLLVLSALYIITFSVSSQVINRVPLSPRQTGYKIDAILDPSSRTIFGSMEAFWINRSDKVVPDIQLHMYMNAFRSSRSTYHTEAGGFHTFVDDKAGWIDMKSITDNEGNDLSKVMSFISPDDGNNFDQTVLRVLLPKPANPGDTVIIHTKFETKLPFLKRRTGFSGDFYFVAQWFPKFGVYEANGMRYAATGSWNCHQFHDNSEFYSNHSLYIVNITAPKEYIIGTGGVQMGEESSADNGKSRRLSFRAEDIVDFAWTAWPGYQEFTDHWHNVKLNLLLPKERTEQVERQFRAVKNALEYFADKVGPYPWPYLTIVDPPEIGKGAGGMEYTTLFTSESSYMIPSCIHFPEMVTIHEFGHAYFMGILANNEFEEPWLDEGVNSFWEERIMDHYYGENSGLLDHPFLKIADKSMSRLSYVHSNGRQDVSNNEYSWNYPHGTYGMMSYNKTATWLYTMMGIVGEETTDEIFREYYKKWAFKHPSGKDFVNIVNAVVIKLNGNKFGNDMNWFFDQTLYGTGLLDYKVTGILNTKTEQNSDPQSVNDSSDTKFKAKPQIYRSVAELERAGEVMLPVEVLIHFDNGEEVHETWDGKDRYKDYAYSGARKIEWVRIDPDYKLRMDINFINNSMTVNPDRIPLRRLTNKLIVFLQFFISFISL
jgi:hypothetical protein